MNLTLLAIGIAIAGGVFCAGWFALTMFGRYHVELDIRLRDMLKDANSGGRDTPRAVSPREGDVPGSRTTWLAMLERALPNSDADRQRHHLRLVQAGMYSSGALSAFFLAKSALMLLPVFAGYLAGALRLVDPRLGLLYGCIIGSCGIVLPSLWLERRIRNRHIVLRSSLPDFLDLMIVCLESGLSLQGTIQRVGDELRLAHPLLAGELSIVQRDVDLGAPVDSALRRFGDRSGFDGIRTLSTFVRESQRFGTELADALRLHADMLRCQREQAAEEMAQKASVKILLPMLLLILPAVFVVVAGPAAIQIQQALSK